MRGMLMFEILILSNNNFKIYHKEVTIFDIKCHSIKDQTPLCTYVPWNSSKTNDNERSKPKKDNLSLTLVFLNLDNGSFQIQYLQRSSSSTCCTVDKKNNHPDYLEGFWGSNVSGSLNSNRDCFIL